MNKYIEDVMNSSENIALTIDYISKLMNFQ